MGIELETFSLKVKNETTGVLEEPAFLKGKDAKSVYAYSVDGGNTRTAANFMTKFSRSVDPYPVGTIYICGIDFEPAEVFGGSWEEITEKFLLCGGTTYVPTNTVSGALASGGAATVTLTTSLIPSHIHHIPGTSTASSVSGYNPEPISFKNSYVGDFTTSSVGGGGAHNNMPPYIVKCVWRRIA